MTTPIALTDDELNGRTLVSLARACESSASRITWAPAALRVVESDE